MSRRGCRFSIVRVLQKSQFNNHSLGPIPKRSEGFTQEKEKTVTSSFLLIFSFITFLSTFSISCLDDTSLSTLPSSSHSTKDLSTFLTSSRSNKTRGWYTIQVTICTLFATKVVRSSESYDRRICNSSIGLYLPRTFLPRTVTTDLDPFPSYVLNQTM